MTRPLTTRPYVLLSCSLSLDGYLDNTAQRRLILSNAADLDRVDEVRACCDAILVGAATVRADNPRLLVRCPERRARRVARGHTASPAKVTITRSGDLDPSAAFFTAGEAERLVVCPSDVVAPLQDRLGDAATVVDGGATLTMRSVTETLGERGIDRLMVEGGSRVHTQFLTEGLADELQLVVAPIFVGDSRAPRFVGDGAFPWSDDRRAELADVRRIGDVVLLRYALSERFDEVEEPLHAS
jgi:5-amino-6-(5-phosphoribosylamino)uracil reductase